MAIDWSFLYRKKTINTVEESTANKLPRVLTVIDLTALGNNFQTKRKKKKEIEIFSFKGVGTTLGSGIYVLAGSVIKNVAGPSLVVSFFIASVVSIIAGKLIKFVDVELKNYIFLTSFVLL